MIAEKMVTLVQNSSVIRQMFEEGKRLSKIYGADKVYDFSLGNPSVVPPKEVREALIETLTNENENMVHGYMNNSGFEDVRGQIAESINKKHGTNIKAINLLMTVGAAGGLNVIFKTLLNPNDEVITFAPFFGEYRNYAANFSANLVVISPNTQTFQPNLKEFEDKITDRTKIVIVNSPNNPTGVVYTEETIKEMASILLKKEKELGTSIYLISDEPYRELVYDNVEVPYLTKYYHNTIIGYSFSKSLSLPGERIGYLVMPDELDDADDIIAAANVANRILGFVNAPSLIQRIIPKCMELQVDVEIYNRNRELLYNSLVEYGFECIKPEGAFYLFVKALEEDDVAFSKAAKEYNILIVPGSAFGCPGYCRMAYCVDYSVIEGSLASFKQLAEDYKNKK